MRICAIGLRGIPDVMGGIETHCEQLYPRLAGLDDKLDIVVIGRSGYVSDNAFGNVRVKTVWAPRHKVLETLVHTPLAILYARIFLHPKIVHLHGIGPGFFAPLARLLGFRVVGTHHAIDYERPKWKGLGRLFLQSGEWMLANFSNEVICVSRTIETSLSNRFPTTRGRLVTIRNGAPAKPVAAAASADPLRQFGLTPRGYILAVGRLDPTKGFHDLVRAFELARPAGLKLVIAGAVPVNDPYATRLQQSASDSVVFVGRQPAEQVRALYDKAALFVHPSYMEGFPLVLMEALASDAPMLVSDIDPHQEVDLGSDSYFKAGNVEQLAARLSQGGYDRLRCVRRADILRENDWGDIARRHHAIMVRQVQRGPVRKDAPAVHRTGGLGG
ncbi:MAG: glycosyltransferase [Alphaproteobacteria bacterium]|nr:glycosyltransferase [Alphaproteobacteria bacterium]